MIKILIVYYSRSGNTMKMADFIAQGAKAAGAEVLLKEVALADPQEMLDYDAVIIGSPTYYGSCAYEIKKFLDESVKFHSKLEGKVGGAFSSSALIGGGNETTILGILQSLLIHGMVIAGESRGDHYGPVSIGAPDERVKKECLAYGKKIAQLADRLK